MRREHEPTDPDETWHVAVVTDDGRVLAHLRQWVATVLAQATTRATIGKAVTQRSGGRGFSLVRFETSGPAVWFKSVGSPNEAEPVITTRVAERHPDHSPRILACHDAWRGWLTEELPAPSLRHASADGWRRAAADLARIQLAERDRADTWLQSGCVDLRATTLASKIDELFDGMEPIFDRQEKASRPRLRRAELKATADALRRALDTAANLPAPDTLVHADLNPDNVFFRDEHAVFLDWAGAFVGVPFVALENLCGHLRRCRAGDVTSGAASDVATERMVRDAYADVWRDAYGGALVNDVLSVAPLLRHATLAMRTAGWLWQRDTPTTSEPLLRSLMRSMHRDIHQDVLAPVD